MRLFLVVLLGVLVPVSGWAVPWGPDRAKVQRAAFQREHPCPVTGRATGACPGYVVDHIKPLCAGGPDHPSNMQWQTVADAKVKDREEVRQCRELKKLAP